MTDLPAASPPLISVQSLRVQFGAFVALRDVSFSLRAGDLLGLIGPNGAGKTTLLRAMAGLQPPTAGRVEVLGEAPEPGGGAMARIGFTPDTPPVYEELTVRSFLRFVAKGYGLSSAEVEERIDFWLEQVWLTEKAGQKIKSLSRGMRQRIGIARTMLPNPAVVLLDEPAAGLDPAGRVQFRQLLCDLREQGKALVVSSHILSDMSEYCTHIGIVGGGRLLRFGTVAEVARAGAPNDGGDAAHDGTRCRYTALLARPFTGLREALESIEKVTAVHVERDRLSLDYPAGRDEAARLLELLIARRIPVASFTADAVDLEQAYLRAGIRQVD